MSPKELYRKFILSIKFGVCILLCLVPDIVAFPVTAYFWNHSAEKTRAKRALTALTWPAFFFGIQQQLMGELRSEQD